MTYRMIDVDAAIFWALGFETRVYEAMMKGPGRIPTLKVAVEKAFLSGAQGSHTDILRAAVKDLNAGTFRPVPVEGVTPNFYTAKQILKYLTEKQ